MGSTQFGNFQNFCRDSTLPICNILIPRSVVNQPPGIAYASRGSNNGCILYGLNLGRNRYLANLGSILVDGLSIIAIFFLLWRSQRKRAAVGRREMQLFLLGFLICCICEVFTVGGFPLNDTVRRAFTGIHLAAIATTFWLLLANGLVGYQIVEDGTFLSVGLILAGAVAIFVGTGYIALDTAYDWTHFFRSQSYGSLHRNYGLYVLYQLWPLICVFLFYVLESVLVLRVLEEKRPMLWLTLSALFFAIGQIFNYIVSIYICRGTGGKIDGCFFQSLFNLLSVITVWIFWSSITEDDWPVA